MHRGSMGIWEIFCYWPVKNPHKKHGCRWVGCVASCPLKSGQKLSHVTCPVVTWPHIPTCSLPIGCRRSSNMLGSHAPPWNSVPALSRTMPAWQRVAMVERRKKSKLKSETGDGPQKNKVGRIFTSSK